jgi:hypothetical protein
MPWYTVTISAAGIPGGGDTALEKSFEAAFIDGARESTASLWWSHSSIDGSITYFISASPDEIRIESIAAFSPTECREPDLSAMRLLLNRGPLATEGGNK